MTFAWDDLVSGIWVRGGMGGGGMTGSEIVVKSDICFTWTEHKQDDFTSRITPFPFTLSWKLLCICDVNMHGRMKKFVPFDPNMLGHSLLLSIFF